MVTDLYPFAPHYLDVGGARLHYLDEGAGSPVVMLHGNPTWSFYYRNLVAALRDGHRCIVPDHVGCGKSDKPQDYPYTLERRVADLDRLLNHLDVKNDITLVVHDWGGMIGLAWAAQHPERIARLVILNTGAFHLPAAKPLPRSIWWIRKTPFGPLLARGFNAFCLGAAKYCVTRKPLAPEVRDGLLAPYDSWANRVAILRFVQDIPLAPGDPGYDLVSATEQKLHLLRDVPMLICWGMRDFCFDHHFLAEWTKRFPNADVHTFADAGHYILEDARDEVTALVQQFVGSPVAAARAK